MVFYRKKLQLIYKFLISQLFKIIYGKVFFLNKNDNDVKFTDINKNSHKYKFVEVDKGRIFTDYVENVAIINKNQILDHVSYQQIRGQILIVLLKNEHQNLKKKLKEKYFL